MRRRRTAGSMAPRGVAERIQRHHLRPDPAGVASFTQSQARPAALTAISPAKLSHPASRLSSAVSCRQLTTSRTTSDQPVSRISGSSAERDARGVLRSSWIHGGPPGPGRRARQPGRSVRRGWVTLDVAPGRRLHAPEHRRRDRARARRCRPQREQHRELSPAQVGQRSFSGLSSRLKIIRCSAQSR